MRFCAEGLILFFFCIFSALGANPPDNTFVLSQLLQPNYSLLTQLSEFQPSTGQGRVIAEGVATDKFFSWAAFPGDPKRNRQASALIVLRSKFLYSLDASQGMQYLDDGYQCVHAISPISAVAIRKGSSLQLLSMDGSVVQTIPLKISGNVGDIFEIEYIGNGEYVFLTLGSVIKAKVDWAAGTAVIQDVLALYGSQVYVDGRFMEVKGLRQMVANATGAWVHALLEDPNLPNSSSSDWLLFVGNSVSQAGLVSQGVLLGHEINNPKDIQLLDIDPGSNDLLMRNGGDYERRDRFMTSSQNPTLETAKVFGVNVLATRIVGSAATIAINGNLSVDLPRMGRSWLGRGPSLPPVKIAEKPIVSDEAEREVVPPAKAGRSRSEFRALFDRDAKKMGIDPLPEKFETASRFVGRVNGSYIGMNYEFKDVSRNVLALYGLRQMTFDNGRFFRSDALEVIPGQENKMVDLEAVLEAMTQAECARLLK